MPLKGKYIKYSQEITLEIFTLIYNKLINSGWTEYSDKIIEVSYSQFKTQYNHLTHQQDKTFNTHVCPYGKEYAETTVQEILGYDPFVKEEFILPEKWCIKRNKENYIIINNWFKDNNYGNPTAKDQYIRISNDNKDYNSSFSYDKRFENYTEITFDQFKKYVLKENNEVTKEEVIKEVIPEYVECIKPQFWANTIKDNNGNLIFDTKSFKFSYYSGTWGKAIGNSGDSHFKPSTKEAFDAQNKPKQQLKQAVHCKTQEEYKAVKEFYNSQNYGGHFYKKNDCIPLDNPTQTSYKDYYVNNNYKLLSFQEWFQQNGYKMGKEVKCNQEFKVGDWVIVTDEILKSAWARKKESVGYIMQIPKSAYNIQGFNNGDATFGICPTNKFGINYVKKWIRHATPEEINNHLISIGQIPVGEPLNTGIEPNKDGMFKYTTGNSYDKDFSTSIVPGPLKMTLSIDDEELPMVNIIKTKTVNLLNLE